MQMRLVATMLILSAAIVFSGCSTKPLTVYVPKQCTVATPAPPDIEQAEGKDDGGAIEVCLKNYEAQKSYAERLREALRACKERN